ncbi:MAG: hypothetical protein EOO43_24745, partial [Flavobacterium sp.]
MKNILYILLIALCSCKSTQTDKSSIGNQEKYITINSSLINDAKISIKTSLLTYLLNQKSLYEHCSGENINFQNLNFAISNVDIYIDASNFDIYVKKAKQQQVDCIYFITASQSGDYYYRESCMLIKNLDGTIELIGRKNNGRRIKVADLDRFTESFMNEMSNQSLVKKLHNDISLTISKIEADSSNT